MNIILIYIYICICIRYICFFSELVPEDLWGPRQPTSGNGSKEIECTKTIGVVSVRVWLPLDVQVAVPC